MYTRLYQTSFGDQSRVLSGEFSLFIVCVPGGAQNPPTPGERAREGRDGRRAREGRVSVDPRVGESNNTEKYIKGKDNEIFKTPRTKIYKHGTKSLEANTVLYEK